MFCTYCGKEIAEETIFCPYCGKQVGQSLGQQTCAQQPLGQQNTYGQSDNQNYGQAYYQPPKKKSNVGLIIGTVVVGVLVFVGIGAFLANKPSDHVIDQYADQNTDQYTNQNTDDNGNSDPDKANEIEEMMADTWENQSDDMTGKKMYFTHDLVNKEENSYWEFLDNKSARLVMGEGSYYEANYTHIRDEIGMMYTEFKFPQYGLPYDELLRVTNERIESDSSCSGYVVIVFTDMVLHNADGSTETMDNSTPVMYYGVTYDKGDYTLYDIVGANSASYYNFICDK